MKKNKLIALLSMALIFIGLSFTNCDDNIPKYDNVKVESIKLNDDLKSGMALEIGGKDTLNIAYRLTVLPQEATNKMQSFSSSNPDVATVDAAGVVRANYPGTTTITVTVDGQSDSFTLTVTELPRNPVTEIQITNPNVAIPVGTEMELSDLIVVLPADATNKSVTYGSDNESIVTVTQEGKITGVAFGTAKVTVTSVDEPSITGEFTVKVQQDYSREGWTLSSSQTVYVETGNSLAGALDGSPSTFFGMVRPNKTWKGVSLPADGDLYFIVDMKQQQTVNYFRLRHKNTNEKFIRYHKIQEILGSNDNVTFHSIATDVLIPKVTEDAIESPNIPIPESSYRYLKFYCKDWDCFYTAENNRGSTVQITEIYLGR